MTEIYGKEGETEGIRREEERPDLWTDTDSSGDAGRASQGVRYQRLSLNRESSQEGDILSYAVGGMLDQLIDDAEKQLVKSRECIVWYREEEKEYEQKLNNFRRLKELHLQQMKAAEAAAANSTESFNDSNGGEHLAE